MTKPVPTPNQGQACLRYGKEQYDVFGHAGTGIANPGEGLSTATKNDVFKRHHSRSKITQRIVQNYAHALSGGVGSFLRFSGL